MTREDIDRIATEYLNDTESEFEMQDVIELADKALILEKALENIKAEIEKVMLGESLFDTENAKAQYNALSWCVEIIDKHISGKEKE